MNKCQKCKKNDVPFRFIECTTCLNIENKCIVCNRSSFLNSGFCQLHWHEEFKEDTLFTHQYKERLIREAIMAYLQKEFGIHVKYDCLIEGSGLKYRPDIFFVYQNCFFMIEIDENQHRNTQYLDQIRDKEIYEKLIGLYDNIYIIRINPDKSKYNKNSMCSKSTKIISEGNIDRRMVNNQEEINYRINGLKHHILKIFEDIIYNNPNGSNRLMLFFD